MDSLNNWRRRSFVLDLDHIYTKESKQVCGEMDLDPGFRKQRLSGVVDCDRVKVGQHIVRIGQDRHVLISMTHHWRQIE